MQDFFHALESASSQRMVENHFRELATGGVTGDAETDRQRVCRGWALFAARDGLIKEGEAVGCDGRLGYVLRCLNGVDTVRDPQASSYAEVELLQKTRGYANKYDDGPKLPGVLFQGFNEEQLEKANGFVELMAKVGKRPGDLDRVFNVEYRG